MCRRRVGILTGLMLATAPAGAQTWIRSWAAAPVAASDPDGGHAIAELKDRTVRQVMRISAGGTRVRIRLSNEMSGTPLTIESAHLALAGPNGTIVPGSDRQLTFSGRRSLRIAAFAPALSDPVALAVPPLGHVAVSLYFTASAPRATWHPAAFATAWIAPGDQAAAITPAGTEKYDKRVVVSAIEVDRAGLSSAVVALGDSITDGGISTVDADARWPDVLAARLQAAGMRGVGVANAGIGGNRLLTDGYGPSALARFDRDVLAVPGARHVIILEGINDIAVAAGNRNSRPIVAEDLIAAYRQLIARAHAARIKVHLATIMPFKGTEYWSDNWELVRTTVNAWIRLTREADGAIDFDRAVRDPADPAHIAGNYDSGDRLHPNDAGLAAMARAIDLRSLR